MLDERQNTIALVVHDAIERALDDNAAAHPGILERFLARSFGCVKRGGGHQRDEQDQHQTYGRRYVSHREQTTCLAAMSMIEGLALGRIMQPSSQLHNRTNTLGYRLRRFAQPHVRLAQNLVRRHQL